MIQEITIKISMHSEEVTISEGQTEITGENFNIPSVPIEIEEVAEGEFFVPPMPEEEAGIIEEAMFIAPPSEEEETILSEVIDEVPEVPPSG